MAVFYRKYRPQTFAEVLNQKSIIKTLQNQVAGSSVAHAYLFTGSRGVGKTSVARILAKAVNCQEGIKNQESGIKAGDACGVCDNCKAIEAGNFMDLVEIDAASNTGVDNIRELIEHVKFSPSAGKYKVFIIDEVHMLSKGAFNALLKTLEEPPRHAIFILATTEINKVPATIVSRTQRFDFKALSPADILEHLKKISLQENLNLADEVLDLVAQNSEGSVRDSLSLLGKVATMGENATLAECQQLLGITDIAVCENLMDLIVSGRTETIPAFFDELSEKGLDYSVLSRDFLEFLRKVLIYKTTSGQIDFSLEERHLQKLKDLAEAVAFGDLIFIIRLFLKAYKDLAFSPSPQIPLLLASIEAGLKKKSSQPKVPAITQNSAQIHQPNIEVAHTPAPVPEPTPEALAENLDLTASLSEVESFFPKVINIIKGINGPLASLIRNSQLLGVENGRILLGVKFLFNKENLESQKNASLINSTIEQVCGKKLCISVRLAKEEKAPVQTAEVYAQALQVFGGELIE
ncbi:MAG: DNA polymerase III subunit gamma/tau [Candidatus Doudnabacteria bacterium]|nr:DNA polymerase III subunit gamma/tau [Candidatus Doudnabacteria bacterium]